VVSAAVDVPARARGTNAAVNSTIGTASSGACTTCTAATCALAPTSASATSAINTSTPQPSVHTALARSRSRRLANSPRYLTEASAARGSTNVNSRPGNAIASAATP